ncbi:hypothetical protein PQX77_002187 [Marasmius sp. AFHP31]|nr:hypothetical protein PQX77_002187 [Marasmius sp. AFHP31]
MHRPVLIRLVRSIKKVQRLDLEGAFEKYPYLLRSWITTRDEALQRNAIMKMDEESGSGRPWTSLCEAVECHEKGKTPDYSPSLKRCAGCLSAVYCSRECQRKAWKHHRQQCEQKRSCIQMGGFPGATPLDHAFVQQRLRHDYKSNGEHIFALKQARKVDHPDEDESRIITIMDYTNAPFLFSLKDRRVVAKKILRGKAGIDEKVVALAMLPRCMRDEEFTYEMLRSDDVA